MPQRRILILGASYGSLLGVKLAAAGHAVTLVCLPAEAALINDKGAIVRLPVKGREGLVEVNSRALPGTLRAAGPVEADPRAFDLVALAMQEPQYRSPGVRELLDAVARARVPCLSIMNMPPLPYLRRLPVRGRKEPVVLDSRKLPGKVTAGGAAGVNPKEYDLVGLCMQEPQYRSPGVRELLDAVAKSKVPCMSIMNMPPLPYVKRIPGLDYEALRPAYTDPTVWDSFDPAFMTLNSPDPQAIRPPEEKVNVLMVTLPTNFKVAKFDNDKHTAILRQLEKDVEAARFDTPEGKIELPVKLKVHDSIFVPLAKWAMLLAGNYRCITKDGMRTAQEAVHTDIETSRSVYNFVNDLSVNLGPNQNNLVPFEKYAAAAQSLVRPASAARALNNGVPNIERADKLVQLIAKQKGLSHPVIDATVALVDSRLEANRKKQA